MSLPEARAKRISKLKKKLTKLREVGHFGASSKKQHEIDIALDASIFTGDITRVDLDVKSSSGSGSDMEGEKKSDVVIKAPKPEAGSSTLTRPTDLWGRETGYRLRVSQVTQAQKRVVEELEEVLKELQVLEVWRDEMVSRVVREFVEKVSELNQLQGGVENGSSTNEGVNQLMTLPFALGSGEGRKPQTINELERICNRDPKEDLGPASPLPTAAALMPIGDPKLNFFGPKSGANEGKPETTSSSSSQSLYESLLVKSLRTLIKGELPQSSLVIFSGSLERSSKPQAHLPSHKVFNPKKWKKLWGVLTLDGYLHGYEGSNPTYIEEGVQKETTQNTPFTNVEGDTTSANTSTEKMSETESVSTKDSSTIKDSSSAKAVSSTTSSSTSTISTSTRPGSRFTIYVPDCSFVRHVKSLSTDEFAGCEFSLTEEPKKDLKTFFSGGKGKMTTFRTTTVADADRWDAVLKNSMGVLNQTTDSSGSAEKVNKFEPESRSSKDSSSKSSKKSSKDSSQETGDAVISANDIEMEEIVKTEEKKDEVTMPTPAELLEAKAKRLMEEAKATAATLTANVNEVKEEEEEEAVVVATEEKEEDGEADGQEEKLKEEESPLE